MCGAREKKTILDGQQEMLVCFRKTDFFRSYLADQAKMIKLNDLYFLTLLTCLFVLFISGEDETQVPNTSRTAR
jgi:hypothetical protein